MTNVQIGKNHEGLMTRKIELGHLFRDMCSVLRLRALNILPVLVATVLVITAAEFGLAVAFEQSNATLISIFTTVLMMAPAGALFYRRGLGVETTASWMSTSWSLALAQLLVYLLFVILSVFALMLLVLLTGIIAAAGGFDPAAIEFEALELGESAASLGAAGRLLLSAIVIVCICALVWVATRLVMFGVATVAEGRVMVFRTWAWTKGNALKIAIFYLVVFTPILSVLIGLHLCNGQLITRPIASSSFEAWFNHFISTGLGIIMTFLIGHTASLAVYRQLAPETPNSDDALT